MIYLKPCKETKTVLIEITQNTPSIISSSASYQLDISGISYNPKHLSGVGIYPDFEYCYNVYINPSGLTIVPFIEVIGEICNPYNIIDIDNFAKRIIDFINDDLTNEYKETLKINSINAEQTIKITKLN